MDTGGAPDLLMRAAANPGGWQTVRGVIAALERHEIKCQFPLRAPVPLSQFLNCEKHVQFVAWP
jgi:hypothetical protein